LTVSFRTLDDLDVAGKRVLVRADLNVPLKDGAVADSTRIDRFAPTVAELASRGARVIVVSHLGRPKGSPNPDMSLSPVVAPFSAALGGTPVAFAPDCVGAAAEAAVAALGDGDVLLLENLRFHAGEEANDPDFVAALAAHADIYVNDAFSAAHRAHASTEGVAHRLPSAAGRMMAAELDALGSALENPAKPVAGVVGGAKISSKLDVLGHLVARMDALVIGGAMANTFLFAQGVSVGASLCERDMADTARAILADAQARGCTLLLPVDAVVAGALADGVATRTVAIDAVPDDQMILDVGPATVAQLTAALASWRTLLWNGPLGAFETSPFDAGTNALAEAVAARTEAGALVSVAGGGDTVAALRRAGAVDRMTYVSSAGGAFLEWLEGKTLPGVAALQGTG
jgi:phosphoglycerate kinase